MALTKVQIVSNAISMLGHKPIMTLDADDADELVTAAEQSFDFLLESSIATNSWRFAAAIGQLSQLNLETPPTFWKSVYQLPSGWVKTIRLYPHNYAWEIYENERIYSMWTGEMFMEYLFVPDISRLPAWFTKYFAIEIASWLCLTNAQKADYYNVIEAKRQKEIGIAMAIDAQNRPSNSLATFPVLQSTLRAPGGIIIG